MIDNPAWCNSIVAAGPPSMSGEKLIVAQHEANLPMRLSTKKRGMGFLGKARWFFVTARARPWKCVHLLNSIIPSQNMDPIDRVGGFLPSVHLYFMAPRVTPR